MSLRLARLVIMVSLVINCIIWSQLRLGLSPTRNSPLSSTGLLRRRSELLSLDVEEVKYIHNSLQCAPLSYPPSGQCAHVRGACPETDTFLTLPHLQGYFCASESIRPVVFIGLLTWLAFLFATIGIGASDFLCPNLATIATVLGLDENVAGVTFLAVGNGSPDVFATFSAMKSGLGGLAIGELLGAASFIVSVVVGSMCIIKPFHVHRRPFLRDVGFFTVAVALMLWILHDGQLQRWEAGLLVGLYVFYVLTVVLATWWEKRIERIIHRNLLVREEYVNDPPQYSEPYRDDDRITTSSFSLTVPTSARSRALSDPNPPRNTAEAPRRANSGTHSPSGSPLESPLQHLPHFSLLTALEFRDVVASLQHQTNASSLAAFETPIIPLGARPYRSSPLGTPLATPYDVLTRRASSNDVNPWDDVLGRRMQLDRMSPELPQNGHAASIDAVEQTVPSLVVHSPTPSSDEGFHISPTRWQRLCHVLYPTFRILFPHLRHFTSKSVISASVAIFATPGVLALTITSPVVTCAYGEPRRGAVSPANEASDGRLIDFEEDGVERVLVAEDDLKEELNERIYNKWLTALQCALGPLFCTAIVFGRGRSALWYHVGSAVAGIVAGIFVLIFGHKGNHPSGRLARCFMGFLVAVVWIMAIADEVISVLKTFGLIFGLSEAIIGLTIFGIGNSMADLVANTSVAVFAPIMGFSACFGGPMMNILIGVGVSGSIIIHETGGEYNLHFSTTLLVSAVGLLFLLVSTLLFVPWNGYFLSRKWGIFLLASYVVTMVANVIVELLGHNKDLRTAIASLRP
ncbi:Sodium/calcium exchanger protein-domain-containing protein [Hysterangium stoloniferum]|nr:Sodium/calcium exchanger protein-domain-containing protein [Hysterangium stoloniferum]